MYDGNDTTAELIFEKYNLGNINLGNITILDPIFSRGNELLIQLSYEKDFYGGYSSYSTVLYKMKAEATGIPAISKLFSQIYMSATVGYIFSYETFLFDF